MIMFLQNLHERRLETNNNQERRWTSDIHYTFCDLYKGSLIQMLF